MACESKGWVFFIGRIRVMARMCVAVAVATALRAAPAIADVPAAADETKELEKVIVSADAQAPYTVRDSASATKLDLSLRETPQMETVFTRDRIDDQDLTTLRQVLDSTPGVYSYAYDSERVLFTSRGFTIDSLLYDGMPAVDNFDTDSVDDSLDTALYERIEIVRGASGLMTGAGSPAASINLVRKHADSDTLTARLDGTVASWSDHRIEGDVSSPLTPDGRVRGRFVGVFEDRESYQNLYRNKRRIAYGIVDADVTDKTRVSVGFDYQDNDPHGNTWGSFPMFFGDGTPTNFPRSVTTATDWSRWNRRTKTVFAQLQQTLAGDWKVHAAVTWRRFNDDNELFYMFGYPDPQTGEGLDPFAYKSHMQVTERSADLYASGPFELFGRRHELVIGYNGSRVYNRASSHEPAADLPDPGNFFNWDGSYPRPEFAATADLVNDIHSRQDGGYVVTRLSLADPLKLIGGVRYAIWKTDYFAAGESPPDGFHYDYRKAIPYAGLIYDVTRNFSLFVSYTEIFKPQNKRDVTGRYLDPIDGRSFEVGIKGEHFGGRLNTALTVFETRQNNVATGLIDPETGEPVLLPDLTQASVAMDGTRTRGFEVEVQGVLLPGWNASLGWSHYVFHDANDQPVRTFVPSTLVRTFTTWNLPGMFRGLTIGGGINWQSTSHTIVGSPDGTSDLHQASVPLLSVMGRYQVTDNVSVQLNGSNLLNRKFYVLDEFDNTYYGEPLRWSVGVSVKF